MRNKTADLRESIWSIRSLLSLIEGDFQGDKDILQKCITDESRKILKNLDESLENLEKVGNATE